MREANFLLDALIDEARMSHEGLAARINQRGKRLGLTLLYDHASVRRWIRDRTVPRGPVPDLICEILGERAGRNVTLADIGMAGTAPQAEDSSLVQVMDHAAAMWRSDVKQAGALRHAEPLRGPAAIARSLSGRIPRTTWTWGGPRARSWILPS